MHTPLMQSTLTHHPENVAKCSIVSLQKYLAVHERMSVCERAHVCAFEAVSLSSPSGVIKARTSHPERSPFFTHSVLPPSDTGPPSNLLHKTSSTNCTLPVGAARPIKVSYLVPIIPSCPPYKRRTLHG
uniref:PPUP8344 n=1 Tax=Poeciliopsis prolifica TaxID=188132 RepID=A0A0S7EW16_9TELE